MSVETPPPDATHAVVLSGGGAHGAYEIGVMEALFSGRTPFAKPIEAEIFTGTSVGAFNAATMASRYDEDCLTAARHLKSLWLDRVAELPERRPNGVFRIRGSPEGYFGPGGVLESGRNGLLDLGSDSAALVANLFRRGLNLTFSAEPLLRRALRLFDVSDLFSTTPLQRLISETLDVERLVEARARYLKIVVTDWDRGRCIVVQNRPDPASRQRTGAPAYEQIAFDRLDAEDRMRAVLASASIPAIFPRTRIGTGYYVDGGVVMNTPLDPAVRSGASVLHVIHLEHDLEQLPLGRSPSTVEALERLLIATPAELVREDIEKAALVRRLSLTADSLRAYMGDDSLPGGSDGRPDGEDLEHLREFLRDFGGRPRLTIHRYRPSRRLGGVFGLLDFRRARLIDLIELGFEDAVNHDCESLGCVV